MGCTGSSARENIDFEALRKKREEELQKIKKEMEELRKKEEEKVYKEIEELKKKELDKLRIELEQKRNEGFSNDNKEEEVKRINEEEEENKLKEEEENKIKEEEDKKIREEEKKKKDEENDKNKVQEIDRTKTTEDDETEFQKLKEEEISSIIPSDVKTPSKDCVFLGLFGDIRTDKQKALDRLNNIRKEACQEGVKDPQTKKKLKMSDYKPLKWSTDLERVSIMRAAEGSLTIAHERLNGKSIWGVVYNNVRSWGENLAWNYDSANSIDMINQWYEEKHDWVTGGKGVTGHYESIISTRFKYVGLGWFYTKIAKYPNTLAGSFSDRNSINPEDFLDGKSNIIQTIEVTKKKIEKYYLEGKAQMFTGESQILTPKVKISGGYSLLPLNRYTTLSFKSADDKIAKVNKFGKITALKQGTVKITCIKNDNSTYSTFDIKVVCNHEKKLVQTVKSTCTKDGKNILECKICNSKIEEKIKTIPHDYNYKLNEKTNKTTGTCKVCGKTINFTAPSKMELFWRNTETAKDSYYQSSPPDNNPVGSIICCWCNKIDGDSGYRELEYEISDTNIIEYPTKKSEFTELKVIKEGEVSITIYAKYNPNLRKTFNLSVG